MGVTADIMASNGVIHVIDNVILPAQVPAVQPMVPKTAQDIVDVAVNAGAFKTLVKLVSDLGLVDTLRNVFAPSDEAFGKLPPGTLESLSPLAAKDIVLTHVVPAKVPAAAVTTGAVKTVSGSEIVLVKNRAGGVQIVHNGKTINVVAADVMARNGIIHVIDHVIV